MVHPMYIQLLIEKVGLLAMYKGTKTTFAITFGSRGRRVGWKNLMTFRSCSQSQGTRGREDQAQVGRTAQPHCLQDIYRS